MSMKIKMNAAADGAVLTVSQGENSVNYTISFKTTRLDNIPQP